MEIYQLRIELLHIRPTIWRRFQVSDSLTLHRLHRVIQIVMGWEDSHRHRFLKKTRGKDGQSDQRAVGPREGNRFTLHQFVAVQGHRAFLYEYDFGDDWIHAVKAEALVARDPNIRYPTCIEGERRCPPEDSGGPHRYPEVLRALHNPHHPDHRDMLDWIGRSFDSEEFDAAVVNKRLRPLKF